MVRLLKVLLIIGALLLAFALGSIPGFILGSRCPEPITPRVDGQAPPDAAVLDAARTVIAAELAKDRTAFGWTIAVDQTNGTVATNWFSSHKGEIWLRVEIAVWGPHYRVDVWQKVGFFRPCVTKFRRSINLQRAIEVALDEAVHAPQRAQP